MSALPRQDITVGRKIDFTGSGRIWTHLGEWSYQTVLKVQVLEETLHLRFWIRPEGQGYTLTFDALLSIPRTCHRIFTSPQEAAQWFEAELAVWLSLRRSEDRIWRDPRDEDQLDMFEVVDFEEVDCG